MQLTNEYEERLAVVSVNLRLCAAVCMYIRMCVGVCTYICTYVCRCVYVHTYVQLYVCVRIYVTDFLTCHHSDMWYSTVTVVTLQHWTSVHMHPFNAHTCIAMELLVFSHP